MIRALLFGLLTALPASADTLRLGTDGDFPPNVKTEADGSLAGFEPELMIEVCEMSGFSCLWEIMAFDALEPALERGEIDAIVSGLSRTSDRETRMAFTQVYLHPAASVVITRADGKSAAAPWIVAAQIGTIQASYVEEQGYRLLTTDTQIAALDALRNGNAHAMIATQSWLATQDVDGFVPIGEPVRLGQGAAIALRRNAHQTVQRLDTALTTLDQNGQLEALRQKWFGGG